MDCTWNATCRRLFLQYSTCSEIREYGGGQHKLPSSASPVLTLPSLHHLLKQGSVSPLTFPLWHHAPHCLNSAAVPLAHVWLGKILIDEVKNPPFCSSDAPLPSYVSCTHQPAAPSTLGLPPLAEPLLMGTMSRCDGIPNRSQGLVRHTQHAIGGRTRRGICVMRWFGWGFCVWLRWRTASFELE